MWWIISILVIISDQVCKLFARYLMPSKGVFNILNGLVKFMYLENAGAAFGILQNSRFIFIISAIVIIAGLIYLIVCKKVKGKIFKVGAGLVIGGGISNLIDRLFLGYVVDYIQLSFFGPVCNLADYAITFGTIILMFYILKNGDSKIKD